MTTDYEALKELSTKAVSDYDELLKERNALAAELKIAKDELSQLEQVVQPMYDECEEIQEKYAKEKTLRTAAETFATKVNNDNKKIKRQSAMLLSQMSSATPIAIDIDIDEANDNAQDERITELNSTIANLQDELVNYKLKLEKARDEISILSSQCSQTDTIIAEREEYKFKVASLEEELKTYSTALRKQQKEFKSLNRASSLAVVDYSSLEEKYETEKLLRLKAESYARELQRKRGSVVETGQVNGETAKEESEVVKKLTAENEKLHTDLSEQDIKYNAQIDELQQQLKDSSSHETIENLEEKLEVVKDDLDRITGELDGQRQENKKLHERIAKMEKEQQAMNNIPLPPPPPPPPGPAAGIGLGRLIISKKKKKEATLKKVVGSEAIKDDGMKGAIEEMMARIKAGTSPQLKPVDLNSRPSDLSPKEEEGGAMKETHRLLVSMKKRRVMTQEKTPSSEPTQLDMILAKRRDRSDSIDQLKEEKDTDTPKTVAELTQGYSKQKSVDGRTPPVPKPKPRKQKDETTAELTARLNAARAHIPDDSTEDLNGKVVEGGDS